MRPESESGVGVEKACVAGVVVGNRSRKACVTGLGVESRSLKAYESGVGVGFGVGSQTRNFRTLDFFIRISPFIVQSF